MSEQSGKFALFIRELRNRRVFRVVAVYLGVGYAILEASSIIIPTMGFPAIIVKIILGLLVIGLPVAIILAWMFQVTPDGIRRSPKSGEKQGSEQKPLTSNGIIIVLLIILAGLMLIPDFISSSLGEETSLGRGLMNDTTFAALLIIIAVMLAVPLFKSKRGQSQPVAIQDVVNDKSIAVLPFTPFGDEKEDQTFADGVHDDILTQLSKIADLKVISRTSVMQYKGTTKLISTIAAELGVAHVLEGSVRRAGEQIRIVAQLIKARSDEHLWAETFDRKYADIFSVQTEVAKHIATAMRATLTPREMAYIEEKPTENLKAYQLYMRGRLTYLSYGVNQAEQSIITDAVKLYQQALELDPDMLNALTDLVEASAISVHWNIGEVARDKEIARAALSRAIKLDPDHPRVQSAQGLYAYYVDRDYKLALEKFDRSIEQMPNAALLFLYTAAIRRRQGDTAKSLELFDHAVELDPLAPSIIGNAAMTAFDVRDIENARKYNDLLIALQPDQPTWRFFEAMITLEETGDIDLAVNSYLDSGMNDSTIVAWENKFELYYLKQDTAEISKLLAIGESYLNEQYYFNQYFAQGFDLLGQSEKAQEYYRALKEGSQDKLKKAPGDILAWGQLGLALAALGQIEEGIKAGLKATQLKPLETDAVDGAVALENLCYIYASAKMVDETLGLVERLVNIPSQITMNIIKQKPLFNFLRDNPLFQDLIKRS
ncbi:MAG: tetratricopeptide repeat protein [Candidatus Marinimicrobia bacterium]|nr:tetratricopeptide repeat protein [Candidatus Neomarinimicrobiota bacterium]